MTADDGLPACLSPEMRALARRMARVSYPPMHTLDVESARMVYRAGGVLDVHPPALARVEDLTIPTRDGHRIAARLCAPSRGRALPVLLFFHGGGFTIGGLDTHDTLCRVLAHGSGAAVLSVAYRLAPRWRFPTAVDDAWDALRWLRAQAAALGLDPLRIAVGGDSAGGTLATVSAIRARTEGPELALQLLIYPGCDPCAATPSRERFASGPVLYQELIDWFFDQYIDERDRDDWRFAPMRADDVDGLAPAWIALAECDPMADDGTRYADKLRMAGVAVDLEIYRGVTHGFVQMGRVLPQARQFHADAAAALRRAFAA